MSTPERAENNAGTKKQTDFRLFVKLNEGGVVPYLGHGYFLSYSEHSKIVCIGSVPTALKTPLCIIGPKTVCFEFGWTLRAIFSLFFSICSKKEAELHTNLNDPCGQTRKILIKVGQP
jgi:DNA-binding nuclear phosphoprotein p8